MKKKVLIIFMSACSLGYAQLGVNTTEITSTLTVQGSISANYREIINSTYAIQQDDCNISYRGNSREGVFYLPSIEGSGDSFGRMYNIKNLSKDKNLEIRTLGKQFLQFGGEYPNRVTDFIIYPGQHMHVVANKENNWVVYDYDNHARKKVKIDNSITENSVVRLGNYSFRIVQGKSQSSGQMYLQIMSHQTYKDYIIADISLHSYIFSNNEKKYENFFDGKFIDSGKWEYVYRDNTFVVKPIFIVGNNHSQVSLITIQRTGEMYRVTCTASRATNVASENIVIHVERLG
ncbi:hypothetical protein [Myroides sp. TSA_177.3]|uniref:hypothetical protein n=1 Tax=Myroides sp. TSA_177.3 TaxID=3415650 RepID=UPI0040453DF3